MSEVHHIQHISRRISRVPSSFWKHALPRHRHNASPALPAALKTAPQANEVLPPSLEQQLSEPHSQQPSGRRDLSAYKHAQHAVYDFPLGHSLEGRLSSVHTPSNGSRAAAGHPQQRCRQTATRRLQSSSHADTSAIQHLAPGRTRLNSQATEDALSNDARGDRQATAQLREVLRSMSDEGAADAMQEHGSRVETSTARSRTNTHGSPHIEHLLQMPRSSRSPHSMRMSLQSPPQGRQR